MFFFFSSSKRQSLLGYFLKTSVHPYVVLESPIIENWIGKFCNFFWLKWGSCGTEKCWQEGLVEQLRDREKRVFLATHPHNPFQGKYPPGFRPPKTVIVFWQRIQSYLIPWDIFLLGVYQWSIHEHIMSCTITYVLLMTTTDAMIHPGDE